MSPRSTEQLYALGHSLYERGRAADAADVFHLLTIHRPDEPKFWFARGAAEQQQSRLGEAIGAYARAADIDAVDPWPLVHLGECAILDGEGDLARTALGAAMGRAIEAGSDDAMKKARGFLSYLEVRHGR